MLPISARSYVSITGQNQDSTFINAEFQTMLLYSCNLTRNLNISNISFSCGFGNFSGIGFFGGFFHNYNDELNIENVTIKNSISSNSPGLVIEASNKVFISNFKCINNLGGLEHFVNLTHAGFSTNNIETFHFPTLNQLEFISLNLNPINNIDLTIYPILKILKISHVNQLDTSNNPILEYIFIENVPNINVLDLKQNPLMQIIHLKHNQVSKIFLNPNTQLDYNHNFMQLDCWDNGVLNYICCSASQVPALTTFLTNCGHNLANITIDTTNTCALSNGKFENYNIAVYPNPSTGLFNLTLPEVFNANVEVFNTLGQKVYDSSIENQQNMVLDLGHLNKGVYFLKVQNEDGDKFEEKIIIAP